jgi:hypothetical protein
LRTQTRRAHDYARRCPGDDARWQDYKTKRQKLKNNSIKARTKSWRKFTADQVSPKQAARLHRILQRKAYNKLSLLKRDDGSPTETLEESYQLLMQEHFPGSMPLQAKDPCAADFDPNETSTSHTHPVLVDGRSWINHMTVDLAFKQFGKHKCPGPDGYRPIVLCNLPYTARPLLLQVFNASIQLKYTQKLWRSSEVIFLPKPGKDAYTERQAFRPISLMPFLFKTLERLVKWRMEQHATPLHKDQHAFRKGHCTENALSHMVDSIEKGFKQKKVILAVFLDIKGAFDNLSTDVIVHGMHKHDVEDKITEWLKGYLDNRFFKLACGTGQGGILSP